MITETRVRVSGKGWHADLTDANADRLHRLLLTTTEYGIHMIDVVQGEYQGLPLRRLSICRESVFGPEPTTDICG